MGNFRMLEARASVCAPARASMLRRCVPLFVTAWASVSFACQDELVEEVTKDVCYSEKRWIGEKRGSPEMYPGRDCVGCHLDNDGPPLAIGGTIYPYLLGAPQIFEAQSGEDCFGIEGVTVTIEDYEGQAFELTTNRAGNFYLEGNPGDLAKPFTAAIDWLDGDGNPQTTSMTLTSPMYGGCARCHSPDVPSATTAGLEYLFLPPDAEYRNGVPRIGLVGYSAPGAPEGQTVADELRAFIEPP
jgi:hypothetical protein